MTADLPGLRATRAIIDLDAIAGNVRVLRSLLPADVRLMAVVKADAYGHGAPWIAREALAAGASYLGVATVGEGCILREFGIRAPILLLSSIDPSEAAAACGAELEITVGEEVLLEAVQVAARCQRSAPVPVHVKVDTGLRRYGASAELALALAARIDADGHLRLAGVSTHFASADEPADSFTGDQLTGFEAVLAMMRGAGITLPMVHSANSAGILTGQGVQYDLVRAGIALYGVQPSAHVPLPSAMRPAMGIESRIARIVPLREGDSVGYNRTYRAAESMLGALVPIGYADGYRRALSGKGWVGIGGTPCQVLGRVSMDQIVVEAPGQLRAAVGDPVHVMNGDPGTVAPDVEKFAALCGTNSYEILVGVSARVPRLFVKGGALIDVRAPGIDASPRKSH